MDSVTKKNMNTLIGNDELVLNRQLTNVNDTVGELHTNNPSQHLADYNRCVTLTVLTKSKKLEG